MKSVLGIPSYAIPQTRGKLWNTGSHPSDVMHRALTDPMQTSLALLGFPVKKKVTSLHAQMLSPQ